MKSFFKMMFASMLGVVLGGTLIAFLALATLGLLYYREGREAMVIEMEGAPVLKLELDSEIVERVDKYPLGLYEEIPFLNKFQKMGLFSLQQIIEHAATDPAIKTLYLKFGRLEAGWASLATLYESLAKFKKSGKTIVAYSESYSEKSYYLASLAQRIYLYPGGDFEFNGLASVQTFFKGLFQKFEVKPQVFRVGKFKSAVEPFLMDRMSEENRDQTEAVLGDIWQNVVERIHKNRHIPFKEMTEWVAKGTIQNAEDALKHRLVDGLIAEGDVLEEIHSKMKKAKGRESKEKEGNEKEKEKAQEMISAGSYLRIVEKEEAKKMSSDNQIALVYINGDIMDGKGQDGRVGSESLIDLFRELKEDDSVKAIVLRINSPGGSALAADVIWTEIGKLRKGTPVIASLGDVAASGAYYIASNCDWIVAKPNSITGSIGVFGLYMNLQDFFRKNLGVTFDRSVTGPFADIGLSHRPLSKLEEETIQKEVERTYWRFLDRVANGRKFPEVAQVVPLAEGRIWSGKKAKELGLIDDWGGIHEALGKASQLAALEKDYYVEIYPKRKNAFWEFLSTFQEVRASLFTSPLKSFIMENYGPLVNGGVFAMMPFGVKIQ